MTESAASLPPAGLPGLDPRWSRLVVAADGTGVERTWHVLDRGPADAALTLLCVHGNPTWSYLWRRVLAEAPASWRVIAVDQLGMGYSERTGDVRRLATRIDDLGRLTDALDVGGPVVTLAHDWGGPVSLGWAEAHPDLVRGIVLTNTAVSQPSTAAAPKLIRLVRTPALLATLTARTPAFVRGTTGLSRPRPPRDVRDAFAAPYLTPARRTHVYDFVADIPLEPEHPSAAALDAVADGLAGFADTPVLMLWGPSDPVFSDVYLDDLQRRLPHADVHRYLGASHLVTEDAPAAVDDALRWIQDVVVARPVPEAARRVSPGSDDRVGAGRHGSRPATSEGAPARRPMGAALQDRADDPGTAVVECGSGRRVGFDLLARTVREVAAGMALAGVRPGDRVAVLVPPGADLLATVYACWRVGAVVVAADAGLGARGMARALGGAAPDHLVASAAGLGLAAATGLRVRGLTVSAGPVVPAQRRALGVHASLADLAAAARTDPAGARAVLAPEPGRDAEAVVVFTSGATGPAKGVVYRHGALEAQRDALAATYGITGDDALVAAFAPWAVLGPALGIASAIPDMVPTRPGSLTASALGAAATSVRATLVWASPAALRSVLDTAAQLDAAGRESLAGVRLLMSAGAPVPVSLLRRATVLMPAAEPHTPYGMTEALPVADISLAEIERAGAGDGVCVGLPVVGVELRVSPLDAEGAAVGDLTAEPGVVGEICVRAAHVKDRYDRLYATERDASRTAGWHRTGDVGHLDVQGRLWVGGRLVHVLATADGVITPVGVEQRVEVLAEVRLAALVGVGPAGTAVPVAVVETAAGVRRPGQAGLALADQVRAAAGIPLAAVLVVPSLPVDKRHNSKIDRTAVAAWAAGVLAGGRPGRL